MYHLSVIIASPEPRISFMCAHEKETSMATSLLIIDDEPKMSGVLARMLSRDGYSVQWTDNPHKAVTLLSEGTFDIILCDLRMPGLSGIDVLEHAKKHSPDVDFVMMTAYATPQTAVESMKKGAIDYLIKPFSIDELRALIRRIEVTRTERPADSPDNAPAPVPGTPPGATRSSVAQAMPSAGAGAGAAAADLPGIIAESHEMKEVITRIRKVAASDASVLLRGESGTGKEVIARAIHRLSSRASAPLISVNCGAIPESLMESELFGHIKGSFTGAIENRKGLFESADGGSIFLDEIGEVPPYLQVKLLRVLQEGEIQRVGESTQRAVKVRVIAATNRDLEADVARGDFRQDLYYRLNVIPITLPPLRERRADIQPLIHHFLRRFSPAGAVLRLSPPASRLLTAYDYPGNIRELENAIEHAVVLCEGGEIQPADLPVQIQNAGSFKTSGTSLTSHFAPSSTPGHLEEIEVRCILSALEKSRYNFTRAAQHLGITRRTLGYRIHKYGLDESIAQHKADLRGDENGKG